MSNNITTFFGRNIAAMYHGCRRSSFVAVWKKIAMCIKIESWPSEEGTQ